jgi:sugar phosphate isomerase/epimerase
MNSSRREFVGRAAGALAGLAGLGQGPGALGAERLGKIGLQLYTVRDAMAKDFDGTLARVARIGYQEVEFAGYFGRTPAQVKESLRQAGVSAPSTHVDYDTVKANWSGALDAARDAGIQYVVVAWIDESDRKTIDDWKRIANRLNAAAREAQTAGLRFAYHNHSYEFAPLEGQVPYDVLLASTDPKLVKLEMDLYWITVAGRNPLDYFARWPGRFPLVHIKDSKGPPANTMTEVGSGVIDWKAILAKHKEAGIEHYYVEHDEPKDAFASITASYEYLRALRY